MKWHQKPYTKTKVIDRGKKSKTLTEVKPAENINKNPENFLTIVPCKRKSLLHINFKTMYMSNRILSDQSD